MNVVTPANGQEVAGILREASGARHTLAIAGNGTKKLWGGPVKPTQITLETSGLNQLLEYERNDLTVSVEAGMRFSELQATLAANGQMIALDPPYASNATVGGILSANSSGPMRHRFGTCRDLVIGMRFATLEGKLISSGGHVVKNVAGLDMGKVLIGSFGTLAVIVSVNLRVHPVPEEWRTFVFRCEDLEDAFSKRDVIMRSTLRPYAMDLLNPAASRLIDLNGYILAVRGAGSRKVMDRYECDLQASEKISGPDEAALWEKVREFGPGFLARQPEAVIVRVTADLRQAKQLFEVAADRPLVYRCGSGVTNVYLESWQQSEVIWSHAKQNRWQAVVEAAPDAERERHELWLSQSGSRSQETFATMKTVKSLFDPAALLNPSRLYGRI